MNTLEQFPEWRIDPAAWDWIRHEHVAEIPSVWWPAHREFFDNRAEQRMEARMASASVDAPDQDVQPAVAVDNPTERPMPVQASEELTRQVEEARALLAILQAALEEVEDNPEIIHWGHAGTMAEVLSALREAVRQINALA